MEHPEHDGSEQTGGVGSQDVTMEQPNCSSQSSQGLETEPEQPVRGQQGAVLPDNIPRNGSFHCELNRCNFCNHKTETRSIFSSHFQRRHAVAGINIHLKATQKVKLR